MSTRQHTPHRQTGMTLTETLISILLLSLIMVAFLGVVDSTSRVAKTQGNIADSTENLRFSVAALVRIVRMAGTGGLPIVTTSPTGPVPLALVVDDNVLAGAMYGGRQAVEGTDALRVRGTILNTLYEIQGENSLDFAGNTLRVRNVSPWPAATEQDLDFPSSPRQRPIVLSTTESTDITTSIGGVREYGGYRLVEVADETDPIDIDSTPDANGFLWMTINIDTAGGSANLNPGGAFVQPPEENIYAAGFMDDIVFFISLNDAGEPSLYRFLGTGTADEVVPNIANLQVSLGCDVNRDGQLATAEWFLSRGNPTAPSNDQLNALREVRVSVVSRSQDPEMRRSDNIVMPENSPQPASDELAYRYRLLTVRTGLRSHPPLV